MARIVAVLPAWIRRRWDAIAIQQLAARALELEEQNAQLQRLAEDAWQSAQMWQYIADIERERGTVGLTVDGGVVDLGRTGQTA